jgi:hypothetical protein
MNRAVRTTVVYALASGFLVVPLAMLLSRYLYWPGALKLVLWADLAVYGVLMARWSGVRLLSVLFPLLILLGAALWPGTHGGFFILALGIFSWLRSGVCFKTAPVRALMAEVLTMVGGAGLLLLIGSHSYGAWALNICLFFLVQSLYFFMVPWQSGRQHQPAAADPFEQAVADAEKVLEGS